MKSENIKEKGKKVYEKPKLITIELAAEEVLSIGCKLEFVGSGPYGTTCMQIPCSEAGS
jgi:hypothetical protein